MSSPAGPVRRSCRVHARLDELRATLPADTLANLVEECLARSVRPARVCCGRKHPSDA